jgi:phosphoglycerol transferase MdoB-like AlkP superfamily enzyme
MKKPDVTYVLGAAFMALTSLFYCCTMWFAIKLPRYYPLERTWKWVNEKDVPSQGWYGMQAFAFLVAGIVTFIIYIVLKRVVFTETSLKPAHTRILGVAATLTATICLGYMLYHEFAKWGVLGLMGLK